MNKRIMFFVCITVLILPVFAFGQTDKDYSNLLQFLKGDGAFEKWFMDVFTKLDVSINDKATEVVLLGKAIGGVGSLLYFGYMGWQMVSGDKEWEIMPMLRPIFFGLIIINWVGFVQVIQQPLQQLAEPGRAIFSDIESEVNDLRIQRFKKQQKVLDLAIKLKSEEDAKQAVIENSGKGVLARAVDEITPDFHALIQPIKEWSIRMNFEIQKLFADFLEFIALAILRICVYLIFFIQKIWSYVLIVLGPIAISIALIPGFENSLYSWISKFININLYTFVAFIIINIGQQMIASSYTMEIERLDIILKKATGSEADAIVSYISGSGFIFSQLFTVVSYIVTGIGILITPTIADAIVSAGGGAVMSKVKAGAGKMVAGGKATGQGIKTAGQGNKTAGTKGVELGKKGYDKAKQGINKLRGKE